MTGFTDTHAHYYFPDFSADQEAAIQRAREAGVERMINVGTDVESSRQSLALSDKYDFIWAAAGIHPNEALKGNAESLQAIEKILEEPRVVAVGEVGLDFYRDHAPREVQIQLLKEFLGIYQKIKKPLIIHCRDAYGVLFDLLAEAGLAPYRGVMHCFSSDRRDMEKFISLGFHISFAGPLTYKKNDELREACKVCPADRLLLETDAPFLPPQSVRGKRNESSFMLETARTAAEVRGESISELALQTSRNAELLFQIC